MFLLEHLFKRPKRSLAIFLALLLTSLLGLTKLSTKSGPSVWYRENDPLLKNYQKFEKEFVRDETISVLVSHPDGVLNPEILSVIKNISEDLIKVSEVTHVDSVARANRIYSDDEEIIIEPYFNFDRDLVLDEVNEKKNLISNDDDLIGNLISKDFTTTFITGYLKPRLGKKRDFAKIVAEARGLLKKYQKEGLTLETTGSADLTHSVNSTSSGDLKKLLPILLLLISLVVIFVFRSFWILVICFSVIISTSLITFGIAGFFNFEFTSITFIVPIILLSICIADTIHLISSFYLFYGETNDKREALKKSYLKNLRPTLMTTLTTVGGFLSLATSKSVPIIEMGVLTGFGVLFAWFVSYWLIAPLVLLLPVKSVENINNKENSWIQLSQFCLERRILISSVFLIITGFSLWSSLSNRFDTNPYEQFKSSHRINKTQNLVLEKFSGGVGPELVIDSGKVDGIKNPEFLRKVDELIAWMLENDYVTKINSILPQIRKTNELIQNKGKAGYVVPESNRAVAEILFLLSMNGHQADIVNSFISFDRRYLRLDLRWRTFDASSGLKKIDEILKKGESMNMSVNVIGKQNLSLQMLNYIFDTFSTSIITSILIITLIICIGLKSFSLGLLSLIPNVFPLLIGGLWLYTSKLSLDFSCVVAFVISLGITVDDTIHFLDAYKNTDKNRSIQSRLANTFNICGHGIVLTTVMLALGFGVLILSDFQANYKLGVLCVLILVFAMLADLILLPAIISLFQFVRRKKE